MGWLNDDVLTRKNDFINKAIKKHNDFFDYSLVDYINAKTHITIICKKHGAFRQSPDKHLNSIVPCSECLKKHRLKTAKERVEKMKGKRFKPFEFYRNLYKNKYDLNIEYVSGHGFNAVVRISCDKHGYEELSLPNLRMRSNKSCSKCTKVKIGDKKIKSKEMTHEELKKLHPNLIFDMTNYSKRTDKIKCYCPEHGLFIKSVQKLIQRQPCPKCTNKKLIDMGLLPGGYCEVLFKDKPLLKNTEAYLYYVKINGGKYYKIGITKNITNRLRGLKNKSKCDDIELIFSKETTLYNAFLIEQKILKQFKKFRVYLQWSTELFKVDISKKLKKYFN
jgi:hypothetical protein